MAAFISGERSAALVSALSLLTISAGVPAGAHSPAQKHSDRPGKPLSIMVGTSGSSGWRAGPHTAIARILPSRISGTSVGRGADVEVDGAAHHVGDRLHAAAVGHAARRRARWSA